MAMKLKKQNKLFHNRAKGLRKQSTLSEVLLWNELKNGQFMGLNFNRQKVINNHYIADLFCLEHNLIIEIDGCSHDNKYEYDKERDDYLNKLGFNIIHIDDLDIKTNIEWVLQYIADVITATATTAPSFLSLASDKNATPSPAKGNTLSQQSSAITPFPPLRE